MTQGFPTATLFVLLFLMGFGEKISLHFKEQFILELSQVNFICMPKQLYGKACLNAASIQTIGDCGKERNSKPAMQQV